MTGSELRFESREQLRELRSQTSNTHVVHRRGDVLRLVPTRESADVIGRAAEFDLTEGEGHLAARLLQESLRRIVSGPWSFLLRRPHPPVFVSRQDGRDLMAEVHTRWPTTAPFHIYPEYRLNGRFLPSIQRLGVVVGIKTRREIDLTAAQLAELGMPLVGRGVLTAGGVESFDHQDPRYARRFCGLVRQHKGDTLLIETSDGLVSHAASSVWVESRLDVWNEALRCLVPRQAPQILEQIPARMLEVVGAPARLDRTRAIGQYLRRAPLALAVGLEATVEEMVGDRRESPLSSRTLTEPIYVFDPSGSRMARYPEQGLRQHGPFDREYFTPKVPHIVVVTPSDYRSAVGQFMVHLRDGIPNSSFAEGLVRRFALHDVKLSLAEFPGREDDAAAYRVACRKAVADHPQADLAIVVVGKAQEHLTGDNSPYLVAKSTFMSQAIPVQEFQIENVQGRNEAEILRNVSLACYAKLGGIPYLVRASGEAVTQELVIGLGSTQRATSRVSPVERFVGITTVFDALGNYLVANSSREASYEDYPEALLAALTECIQDVRNRNSWEPGRPVRLVFHVFKPLRDREARAVKRLVEHLASDFSSLEFAFVHVSDDHDWTLLDPSAEGIAARRGAHKGVGVPARGNFVQLGPDEVLVTALGPRDLKTATQGPPQPLLLKLHRQSTFMDLDYLAQQLFTFTAMSWRRPFPASQPVSILYSELMARLLGQLREVRNWNSDLVVTGLQNSRWFL